MRKKCALIVDDSRTAREMLAKRLADYDINIVKVDSAANAIDYLYSNTPDAVFMDYEMPGMDGFQALRVIKSNPNTATIPVMMYTSKEGGLALGEARALGAIGVLPKQMGAQDLDAVVEQLHLLPEQVSLVETFHEQDERHHVGGLNYAQHASAKVEYLDDSRSHRERVEYPGEVYDESLFVLKRQTRIFQKDLLAVEQRLSDQFKKECEKIRDDFFSASDHFQELNSGSKPRFWMALIVNLLIVLSIGLFWLRLDGANTTAHLKEMSADLRTEINQINQSLASLEPRVDAGDLRGYSVNADVGETTKSSNRQVSVEVLEWAANRGTEFDYGENPYNDFRILWLSELVEQLTNAGFQGVINLQAHYGDFCLTKGDRGTLTLAKDQMPFSECLFSSQMEDKGFAQSSYQTIGFANYVNSVTAKEGAKVDIFVEADAQHDPLVSYPETYSVKTAGEWNRVAAQNQRIQVSLFQKTAL